MDFCNWYIPTANVQGRLEPVFKVQKGARDYGIVIPPINDDINLKFSWQNICHGNNVEENTYRENEQVWALIEDLMKDITFAHPLEEIIIPYTTEFSKNVFLVNCSNGEALQILQRIKTSAWNTRFKRGDTDYFAFNSEEEGDKIEIKENENGSKISFWTRNVHLSVYAKNIQLASKRDVSSQYALHLLNIQQLTVIRFEVRVKTRAKLREIMHRIIGKQIWNIKDLFDPITEANIVQYFFLPILEQVPPLIPNENIIQYFENGLQAGFSQGDMEHAIGHSMVEKMYPSGAYRNVVVDKSLSPKEYERRKAAWQYNKTKTAKILEAVAFVEDSKWARQKDEIIRQLVEFQPFHFSNCGYLPEENAIEQKVVNC